MTPEAMARQNIEALLVASGWHICDLADANQISIATEVIPHLPTVRIFDADVDINLKRA